MPAIRCQSCHQETLVLSASAGRRHCSHCGELLMLPVPARSARATAEIAEMARRRALPLAIRHAERVGQPTAR